MMAKCPTCGAVSEDQCGMRWLDAGCDHPAQVQKMRDLARELSAAEALRTPDAHRAGEEWRSIETAPKDGSEVDLWLAPLSDDGRPLTPCRVPNAHYHCGEWLIWGGDPEIGWRRIEHRVTHWQPLPPAPKAE